MQLKLANWVVDLALSPPALEQAIHGRFAAFASRGKAPADLSVEVQHEAYEGRESLLEAPLATNGQQYLFDGPQFYGIIEPLRSQAALRLSSELPTREVEYFLRVALALFALQRDGLLVHCAALKRAGQTYLFVGQSGSGKSTVVALSHAGGHATALGDDLILLRRSTAGWQAYGTPFWNLETQERSGEKETGPVAAIYKLVQDQRDFAEPLSPAAGTAELLANCPIINNQPSLLPAAIERCREIARAIGVQRLHFRKDDAFWTVVQGRTGGGAPASKAG